jgi:hypothetical protein
MRTRIALVATTSVAVITVTLLTQAATAPPARAATRSPHQSVTATKGRTSGAAHRADQLTALVTPDTGTPSSRTTPDLRLVDTLLSDRPAGHKEVTPVVPPPPPPAPGPVDTVTPAQRAAWDRVAMCEEGGNWESDGSRFSGGLGITRSNWAIYGGLQYAPEAAEATPDEQIMVAERIQASPPDQGGCSSW